MKVLVACEESQRVCMAFRLIGHEAYSCDIITCSGGHPEWHIIHDVTPLLDGNCEFETMDGKKHKIKGEWDMIIAFPPCTYLSKVSANHLRRNGVLNVERYNKGLEAKKFFERILNANCRHIAVENPVSLRIFEMPKYTQEIEPWQFGHPYIKKTRLWLKGLPLLKPTDIVTPVSPYVSSSRNGIVSTAKLRSKTFEGVAKAMADQWGVESTLKGCEHNA